MPITFFFTIEEAPAVDPLTDDSIVLFLDQRVVVNDEFFNTNNYTVSVVGGSGSVRIRKILGPRDGSLTTNRILLHIDKLQTGIHYQLVATNLTGTSGLLVGGSGDFIARKTKTQLLMQSIPRHYDTSPRSVIRQLLIAIGVSDDEIGGSRSDYFT